MRLFIIATVLVLATPVVALSADAPSPTLDLMPVPAQIELGTGAFEIDEGFAVSIQGDGAGPRLQRGVRRMLRRLSDRSTLFFGNETFLDLENTEGASLRISAGRQGELIVGEDESYRLKIAESGI